MTDPTTTLAQFRADLANATTPEALNELKTTYLGKKSYVKTALKSLGAMGADERAAFAKGINDLQATIERELDEATARVAEAAVAKQIESEWQDLTLPGIAQQRGSTHPLTQVHQKCMDVMRRLGFRLEPGPDIETPYYNFDALNIPENHPARDMQDTFWLEGGHLLRTHTSPVQVRGMRKLGPPLRMIAPGRVFRNEEVDASHEHTFYQLEGMMVDRDVSVANLIYFMKTLLSAVFKREVTVRLRPGYFPFVEPGFELDIQCLICGGPGCAVCKQSGWVELLPCGLVHPNVLRMGGIDPEQWNGFAFGLGMTRLVMMRYAIDDIRLLQGGDLRFISQF